MNLGSWISDSRDQSPDTRVQRSESRDRKWRCLALYRSGNDADLLSPDIPEQQNSPVQDPKCVTPLCNLESGFWNLESCVRSLVSDLLYLESGILYLESGFRTPASGINRFTNSQFAIPDFPSDVVERESVLDLRSGLLHRLRASPQIHRRWPVGMVAKGATVTTGLVFGGTVGRSSGLSHRVELRRLAKIPASAFSSRLFKFRSSVGR